MSIPTRAEIVAGFYDAIKQAEVARDAGSLRKLANLAAQDDDMELADLLMGKANKIEEDDNWAYDRHVDNTLND